MNEKLKYMTKKGSFSAYRMTENGCLEVLGRDHKIIENFFLFDGEHYYFNNQLVQSTSDKKMHKDLILAMTDTKLLIPQENEDYLYIARNHMANKDLLVVVLYYYNDHIHYTVVSGNGSGRVHPIYLPLTEEGFKFCFHFAVEAIAAVKPAMADTLFASLKQKCDEAKAEMANLDE